MMDLEKAISVAGKISASLTRRYGLREQFDRCDMADITQSAILGYLEASSRGQHTPSAIWRGAHDQIRLMVFGSTTKRSGKLRPVRGGLDSVMDVPSKGMSPEESADWITAADRLVPGSEAHDYFLGDMPVREISDARGVGYFTMRDRIKRQSKKAGLNFSAHRGI